jgi:hypothetical protein
MRAVVQLRDKRQADIDGHPFITWLRDGAVPLDRRLDWAPMVALFVMQFRDMQRLVMRYPEPRDELEWTITAGTREDETHSGLFLEDWRALGLNRRLGWRTSDTLWWLFLSDAQEALRRCGMRYITIGVADGDDPLIRFASSEAVEATGYVMLSATEPIATDLAARTGNPYRYFGAYHLARETGHVANTEGVFERRLLTDAQRSTALRLCDDMFELIGEVFTACLAYARRYAEADTVPARPGRAAPDHPATPSPIEALPLVSDPRHATVWRVLEARRKRAVAHPFYAWLGDGNGLAPQEQLCRFIPMWTLDILGYRDLAKYAFTYPEPSSAAEQALNRWAAELSTHSGLFLNDWDGLALDDRLGFGASDTLEFLFLDPDMDLHRQHLVEFAQLAMRHPDPALRWWLMTALEATGETFFERTAPLAQAAEHTTGVRLDYLAGRHAITTGARDARPKVPPTPLQPGDEEIAIGLVNAVFDAFEEQLTRSYAVARADKLAIGHS